MQQYFVKNDMDFFYANFDFTGNRKLDDCHESVEYRNNSIARIWYNDLPVGFERHCHTAIEIIIPVENDYEVVTSSETFHIAPGEIMIIPPGEMHELVAPSHGVRFIYLFDISFMEKMSGFARLSATIFSCPILMTKESHPKIYDEFFQALAFIRNEYFTTHEFSDFTIFSVLLNIFSKFGYQQMENMEYLTQSGKQAEYSQKFHEVIEYIDEHYAEDICLEQIAHSIGFSKYHFSRLFKQYTNYTFCDYLNFRRIKAAENLLAQKKLPVTEIALRSGFSSISTFNRLFKQFKGCSPSEYRAKSTLIDFSA